MTECHYELKGAKCSFMRLENSSSIKSWIADLFFQFPFLCSGAAPGSREEAVILEEQVGDLQKEAANDAADSLAALSVAALRSLQEMAALKVWRIFSCSIDSRWNTASGHGLGNPCMAHSKTQSEKFWAKGSLGLR